MGSPPEQEEATPRRYLRGRTVNRRQGATISTGRFRRGALRVLIADDDALIRALLGHALKDEPDLSIVAVAETAAEAIAEAEETQPDLALLDVNMPAGGGPAAAEGIRRVSPATRLVALSAMGDAEAVRAMLDAGCHSYLVKGMPLDELTAHLRAVGGHGARAAAHEDPPAEERRLPTRLLIVEDEAAVLAELAQAVDTAPDLELVGLAQTPYHAVSLAACHLPDVALVNARLPGGGGARVAAEIRGCSPLTRIVPFSGRSDHQSVLEIIRGGAGADGATEDGVVKELLTRLEAADEGADLSHLRRVRIGEVLAQRQLHMVFQPIQALGGGQPVGFEALARFDAEPQRTPDVWFADASSVGLGVELELLAATMALESLPLLPAEAFIAINVSPAAAMSDALRDLVAPHTGRVLLEITEHAPVTDYGALCQRLWHLREFGVRLAVDDCGAGFASLRHVLLLDPEMIKLDITLCRGLADPMRRALARALVSFARETNRQVIAEGIETESDLDALRGLGVQYGQGYLLGRPDKLPAGVA